MDSVVQLINEVGFPIAAAIGLGLFIWKLINKIIDVRLKIKLKLFFVKTPIIKIEKTDKAKKISGKSIFRLLIIFY